MTPAAQQDETARAADQQSSPMQQPTNEPVHRPGRDEWWESVREALDDLDPEQAASYQAENRRLE